ncbi:MAG: hypothetical protein ACO4AY_11775, partial [Ilumatobacteraceae bacterium]
TADGMLDAMLVESTLVDVTLAESTLVDVALAESTVVDVTLVDDSSRGTAHDTSDRTSAPIGTHATIRPATGQVCPVPSLP